MIVSQFMILYHKTLLTSLLFPRYRVTDCPGTVSSLLYDAPSSRHFQATKQSFFVFAGMRAFRP